MTNINDKRILELKKQIEAKKEKLGKTLRFTPLTNCSIELDGVRHNINVLTKDQLVFLMVKLHSYFLSAKDLGYVDELNISGYGVRDWVIDIKSKIDILIKKDEEKSLKLMEEKLSKLLSDGKKVELEIDEIASFLSDTE